MSGKWVLNYGIHRGTIISRDGESLKFDTEKQARDAWQRISAQIAKRGCFVWFATLISPNDEQSVLHAGDPYQRW